MYFECARQLENDLKQKHKQGLNFLWLVLSDCIGIRRRAHIMFGKKVGLSRSSLLESLDSQLDIL